MKTSLHLLPLQNKLIQLYGAFLIPCIILSACSNNPSKPVTKPADIPVSPVKPGENSPSQAFPEWTDSVIEKYIANTDNELIQTLKKKDIPIEWIFDKKEMRDSVKYFVFQVGHTFENKFITDSWLYIDSLSKKVFEYNIAADSLMKQHN